MNSLLSKPALTPSLIHSLTHRNRTETIDDVKLFKRFELEQLIWEVCLCMSRRLVVCHHVLRSLFIRLLLMTKFDLIAIDASV